MTVEKLREKIENYRQGVRTVEGQIAQLQESRVATLGAIEALEQLVKEVNNEKNSIADTAVIDGAVEPNANTSGDHSTDTDNPSHPNHTGNTYGSGDAERA